jgi:hypothetical protein
MFVRWSVLASASGIDEVDVKGASAKHSGKRIPPSTPLIEPRCIPVIHIHFSTSQFLSNQAILSCATVHVYAESRNCTFRALFSWQKLWISGTVAFCLFVANII